MVKSLNNLHAKIGSVFKDSFWLKRKWVRRLELRYDITAEVINEMN